MAPRHEVEVVSQGEAEQEALKNLRDAVGLNLCGGQSRVAFPGKDGKKITLENILESQYIAGYNYFFVHNDKSHGIHNTACAVQLLQGAYQNLTGKSVPNAYIR